MNTRILTSLLAAAATAVTAAPASAAHIDSHLRIIQTTAPQMPASFAHEPVSSGEAIVIISVDEEGKLVDLLVDSYTHQAFADAAVAALREWRYEPARMDGRRIGVRAEVSFYFEARGKVVSVTSIDAIARAFLPAGQYTDLVCPASEVDRVVEVREIVSPPIPTRENGTRLPGGSVLLDFYIDQEGRPRMPVILNAPSLELASAAIGALNQWQFTPATRHGRAVVVRAQQEFVFP